MSERIVLLAWEMGAGRGHAARLLVLAQALKGAGWSPVVAARDTSVMAAAYRSAGVPVLQAPGHKSLLRPGERFSARSYADIMAVCGYRNAEALEATVAAWDALIRRTHPGVIVADYCPILPLAALGLAPVVTVGDGFVTPPGEAEAMPVLQRGSTALEAEAKLLANAAQVQRRRGLPEPRSLPSLAAGQRTVVCTFPELDIYGAARSQPATGPLRVGPAPLKPAGPPGVFAYLAADYPGTSAALRAAADTGLPVEAFVRDAPAELIQELTARGLRVHREAPSLGEALGRASVLLHHGGIGTAEEALFLGRPQVLLPRHIEQTLTARNLGRIGVGVRLPRDASAADAVRLLHGAATSEKGAINARVVAQRLAGRRWESLERVLAACDELAIDGRGTGERA